MAQYLSADLRIPVIGTVEAGMSRNAAARRFGVSIASAVRWMDEYLRSGRIEAQADLLMEAIEATPDITLAELRERLITERGETFAPSTIHDLKARPSRGASLFDNDAVANRLREQLGAAVGNLKPYQPDSNLGDERFIARFANNMLQRSNWTEVGDGKLAVAAGRGRSSCSDGEEEGRVRQVDGNRRAHQLGDRW